jgi:hypothetical protein
MNNLKNNKETPMTESRFRSGPLPCLPWSSFKHDYAWWVGYVPWWWPRPLFDTSTRRQIGWVWRQRAALVRNLDAGWVAWTDDQTEQNLKPRCEQCGRECET